MKKTLTLIMAGILAAFVALPLHAQVQNGAKDQDDYLLLTTGNPHLIPLFTAGAPHSGAVTGAVESTAADVTKYLRGDGTWQTIAAGSYIGDVQTHTAGGTLDMNDYPVTNVSLLELDGRLVFLDSLGGSNYVDMFNNTLTFLGRNGADITSLNVHAVTNTTTLLLGAGTGPTDGHGIRIEAGSAAMWADGLAPFSWSTLGVNVSVGNAYRGGYTAGNQFITSNEVIGASSILAVPGLASSIDFNNFEATEVRQISGSQQAGTDIMRMHPVEDGAIVGIWMFGEGADTRTNTMYLTYGGDATDDGKISIGKSASDGAGAQDWSFYRSDGRLDAYAHAITNLASIQGSVGSDLLVLSDTYFDSAVVGNKILSSNEISTILGDYLPLSAGSGKPLTGDLYMDNGSSGKITGSGTDDSVTIFGGGTLADAGKVIAHGSAVGSGDLGTVHVLGGLSSGQVELGIGVTPYLTVMNNGDVNFLGSIATNLANLYGVDGADIVIHDDSYFDSAVVGNKILSSNEISTILGDYVLTTALSGYVAASDFTADGDVLVGTGSGTYAAENGNTARTSLGLGTGDSPSFTAVTATTGPISVDRTTGAASMLVRSGDDSASLVLQGIGAPGDLATLQLVGDDTGKLVLRTGPVGDADGGQLSLDVASVDFNGAAISNYFVDAVEITADLTLTAAMNDRTIVASNEASEIVVTLPNSSEALVGTVYSFVNLSTNLLTIDAGDDDVIEDSDAGGQIYSGYADNNLLEQTSIQLELVDHKRWHITRARGTWTTTGSGSGAAWTTPLGTSYVTNAPEANVQTTNFFAPFGVTFLAPPAVTLTLATNHLDFQAVPYVKAITESNVNYVVMGAAGLVHTTNKVYITAIPTL